MSITTVTDNKPTFRFKQEGNCICNHHKIIHRDRKGKCLGVNKVRIGDFGPCDCKKYIKKVKQ